MIGETALICKPKSERVPLKLEFNFPKTRTILLGGHARAKNFANAKFFVSLADNCR